MPTNNDFPGWHGTTIVSVRKGNKVVIAGDGQVSVGNTVMKHNARKVRRLAGDKVIGGFAGATADAFTLFERLEKKLEQYPDQLMRAAVELAKDWRTDRYLRHLEAMMIVADKEVTLVRKVQIDTEPGSQADMLDTILYEIDPVADPELADDRFTFTPPT